MNELLQHPKLILEVLLGYWAFSAIVSGMPAPIPGQFWYQWLYTTAHTFSGSLRTAINDPRLQSIIKPKENQ